MTTTTMYHYPNCSTCRKARKWLAERGIEVDLVDITLNPPSADKLLQAFTTSGKGSKAFFNTSGQSYRGGGFKAKLPGMDDQARAAALAVDGKLIKRPLLFAGGTVLVGFRPDAWADALTA